MVNRRLFLLAVSFLFLTTAVFAQVGNVEGVVLLPNHGGPAAGAAVTLYLGMMHDSLTTTADDSGRFAFDSVGTGMDMVRATLTGYLPAMQQVWVQAGHTAHVMLVLFAQPTGIGRVDGVVLLPNHAGPAVGATVWLFRARGDSMVTTADDSGRFVFDSARVGQHDIYASLTGYSNAHAEVRVMDGQTAHVSLFLTAPLTGVGRVEGVVFLPNHGGPAAGATVWLFRARADSVVTTADDSGRFVFDSARVGEHDIHAMLANVGSAHEQVRVIDGQTVHINLYLRGVPVPTFGNIAGTVNFGADSLPAAGATVTAYFMHRDSLTTTTDAAGHFAFDSVRTGEYMVVATLAGYLPARREVNVRSGQTANVTLILRVQPTAVVEGLVTLADQSPVARAFVFLGGQNHHGSARTMTDSTGHFAFNHVAAGHYMIGASARGLGFVRQEIDVADGQTLDLTLVLSDSSNGGGRSPEAADPNSVPVTQFVANNYPNPFNPTTTISYSVPTTGLVRLSVYDVLGRKVADLVNGYKDAGSYNVSFNGESLPSGLYFYRLTAGNLTHTGRMMLLK